MAFELSTLLIVAYSLLRITAIAEIYSSHSHTQKIHSIEFELNDALKDYIAEQENRLEVLKRFAGEVKRAAESSAEGPDGSFMGHPINSYLMIKRFVNEWPKVEKIVGEESNFEGILLDKLATWKIKFPTEDDLKGAITAIKRLQEVYLLKPADFSEGRFGYKPPSGYLLGPKDTYKIGRQSYIDEDYVATQEWMEETLRLMDLGVRNNTQPPRRTDVLDHLAFATFQNGDAYKALNYTLDLLKIDPGNERQMRNIRFFHKEIEENKEKYEPKEKQEKNVPTFRWMRSRLPMDVYENFNWHTERDIYKRLCRGEKLPVAKQTQRRLVCWHYHGDPLCIIRPCRIERVFTDPDIVIFRDIITEGEIKEIRQISEPLLNRATVHNPITGHLETAHYRVSKNCWLSGQEHGGAVERVERRIAAMSKLDIETAEGFQVQNYGLAGQYDPHFDFSRNIENSSLGLLGTGNRIATVLVWMSQVESGGATVFPYVGARVVPQKGDAIFWHNLLRSGRGDFRTRHAGCPVLSGTKWVANKWIHEYGNEWKRPCSLRQDE